MVQKKDRRNLRETLHNPKTDRYLSQRNQDLKEKKMQRLLSYIYFFDLCIL